MKGFLVVLLICVASASAQQQPINFEELAKPFLNSLSEQLQAALNQVIEQLKNKFGQFGKRDLEIKTNLEQVKQQILALKPLLVEKIKAIFSQFVEKLNQGFPNGKRDVENAQNDVISQLQGLFGQVGKSLQDLLAALGTHSFGKALDFLNENVVGKRDEPAQIGAKDQAKDMLSQMAQHLKDILAKLASGLAGTVLDAVNPKAPSTRDEVAQKGVTDQLKDMGSQAAQHIKDILAHIFGKGFGNILDAINPNTAGVGKRGLADNFTESWKALLETLVSKAKEVGTKINDHIDDTKNKLKPHYDNLKDQLVVHGINGAQALVDALSAASKSLTGKRDILNFNEIAKQIADKLKFHVNALTDAVLGHGKMVSDTLKPHIENLKNELIAHGLNAVKSSLDALVAAKDSLVAGKRDVLGLKEIAKQISEALKGHIDNLKTAVIGHANDVKDKVMPHIDNLKNDLTAHGVNALQSLLNALLGAKNSLTGANKRDVMLGFKDLLKQMTSVLNEKFNALKDAAIGHKDKIVNDLTPHIQNAQDALVGHGLAAIKSTLDALANGVQALQG